MAKRKKLGPYRTASAVRSAASRVQDLGDRMSSNVRSYSSIAGSALNTAATKAKIAHRKYQAKQVRTGAATGGAKRPK